MFFLSFDILTSFSEGNETLNDGSFREDPKLDYLRRSIYLVAHGLHWMIEDHCGSLKYRSATQEGTEGDQSAEHNSTREECVSKMHVNASAFVAYLNRTSFVWPPGATNASERIQVNPPGVYNIYNFRKVYSVLEEKFSISGVRNIMEKIGSWRRI